jgi:antitoxin (DNA-binding transcriptional repressor) of toxin-antitoxin stability system
MKTLKINASDFKARCLRILDDVQQTGAVVTILKHGKVVAELRPALPSNTRYPQQELLGSVTICGDLVGPVLNEYEMKTLSDR